MYWTVVRRSIISTRRTLCQDIRGTAKSGPSLKLFVWINGLTRSKQCKLDQSNKYGNEISEFLTECPLCQDFEAQTSLNHLVSDQFAENNAKLNRYWETLHPKGLRIGNSKTFDAFFFAGQILPTWPCSSLSAAARYQWAVQCPECVTRLSRFPVDAQFPSPW